MAITLADFTKIWASTSPLTPYSFSESNYKEGWNFIGSTPPARQMWDSIQNQNDEKLKYIVDNFLPLNGGTMTGAIVLADGGNPLSTAGGTMTGAITLDDGGNPLSTKGGTIAGNLSVNGTLKQNNEDVLTSSFYTSISVTLTGNVSANSWADFSGNITYPTGYSHALCIRSFSPPSPANMTLVGWEITDTTVKVRLYSKIAYNDSFTITVTVTTK